MSAWGRNILAGKLGVLSFTLLFFAGFRGTDYSKSIYIYMALTENIQNSRRSALLHLLRKHFYSVPRNETNHIGFTSFIIQF